MLHRTTYRKSNVIKYVYMYEVNTLPDSISPALLPLPEKYLGFSVPTTDFIPVIEIQHKSYLDVIFYNEINFKKHVHKMSMEAINLLSICRCNSYKYSNEIRNFL